MFSDERLRHAAASSVAAFLETVERDYDSELPWEPSETFLRKLRRLTRRADHPVIYHTMRTAAAVFLAILTMATAWLSTDQRAQAAFIAWVRDLYENSVVYDFFGPSRQAALPEYDFSFVPEGYTETLFIYDENECIRIYENDEGGGIILHCTLISEGLITGVFSEDFICEKVQIGSLMGEFFLPTEKESTNELIWIDEEEGVLFQVSSFLEKETMIKLAEKIIKNS